MTFVIGAIRELQDALSGFFLSLGHQYQHSLFATNLFEVMDTPPAIPRAQNAPCACLPTQLQRSSWTMCHLLIPEPTSWS